MATATKTKKTTRKAEKNEAKTSCHTLYNSLGARYSFRIQNERPEAPVIINLYINQKCVEEVRLSVAEARTCYASLLKLGWQKW